jgi:hypothetical protein
MLKLIPICQIKNTHTMPRDAALHCLPDEQYCGSLSPKTGRFFAGQ